MIKGFGAAAGYAFAKAENVDPLGVVCVQTISMEQVNDELKKFDNARNIVIAHLQESYDNVADSLGDDVAEIFAVHQMLLEDPAFQQPIQQKIKALHSADYAIDTCCKEIAAQFSAMQDAYLKERAADFLDLRKQLLNALHGKLNSGSKVKEKVVLVGKEVLPSDLLEHQAVAGIVMCKCGQASHVVILARSLGIPVVVGIAESDLACLMDGAMLIIDGATGEIIMNPTQSQREAYANKIKAEETKKRFFSQYINSPSETLDGVHTDICANISSLVEAGNALENGADGIGLFRTEFLYMNRLDLPTEEEQYKHYSQILTVFGNKPVIIRTMDIGADKQAPSLHLPQEENPAMGYRAIRICLAQADLFLQQIRALLRASIHGNLWIMLPMIGEIEELIQAKKLIAQAKRQLEQEEIQYAENIPVGTMIEIPSAALQAEFLAKEADFFSIGTNDLTQYTLAVDRNNAKVSDLYKTTHPAVLKLIAQTCNAAVNNNIPCCMCGEAAGNSLLFPLWLGMGVTKLSMNTPAILPLRAAMRKISKAACIDLWSQISKLYTVKEVEETLTRFSSVHKLSDLFLGE